jgi:hypothetical protein
VITGDDREEGLVLSEVIGAVGIAVGAREFEFGERVAGLELFGGFRFNHVDHSAVGSEKGFACEALLPSSFTSRPVEL